MIFRKLSIWLSEAIYGLIPPLYGVFYDIAESRFFTEGVLDNLSNNLYVLMSVVMLFTFGAKLIQAIVNPDILWDKKNGVFGLLKRSIIALVLIVAVPIAFDELYIIQGQILKSHIIEKLIVGFSGATNPKDSNVGQVLAGSIIVELLYPEDDAETEGGDALQVAYNSMLTEDIKQMKVVGKYINEEYESNGEEKYVFHYEWLVAPIVGGLTLYFLILFCMDTGLRLVKLALLELTAPISIIAFIYGGTEVLKKWFDEVKSTYLGLFFRIVALSFFIFGIQNMDQYMQNIKSDHSWIIKIFIYMGLLTIVKEVPNLIEKLFGVKLDLKGGIGGRLGNMSGVGKVAQGAWNSMKGLGTRAIKTAGIGAAGLVAAGAGAAALGIDNKFGGKGQQLAGKISKGIKNKTGEIKNSNLGQQAIRFGKVVNAGAKAKTGSMIKDMNQAWKDNPLTQTTQADKQYKQKEERKENLRNNMATDNVSMDEYGNTRVVGTNANGNVIEMKTNKANTNDENNKIVKNRIQHYKDAADANRLKETIKNNPNLNSSAKDASMKMIDTNERKVKIDTIKDERQKVLDNLDTLISNSSSQETIAKLQDIKAEYNKSGDTDKLTVDLMNLSKTESLSTSVTGNILNSARATDSLINSFGSELGVSSNSVDAISKASSNIETVYNDAKARYDSIVEKSDDRVKEEMKNAYDNFEKYQKDYVKEVKNQDKYTRYLKDEYGRNVTDANGNGILIADYANVFKNVSESSDSSNLDSNVRYETLQQGIDRINNVYESPTVEEHRNKQAEYNDLFYSDIGQNYLNANEREISNYNPQTRNYTQIQDRYRSDPNSFDNYINSEIQLANQSGNSDKLGELNETKQHMDTYFKNLGFRRGPDGKWIK